MYGSNASRKDSLQSALSGSHLSIKVTFYFRQLPVTDWAKQSDWALSLGNPHLMTILGGAKRGSPLSGPLSEVILLWSSDLPSGWQICHICIVVCYSLCLILFTSLIFHHCCIPYIFALPSPAHICFLENPICDPWWQKWSKKAGSGVWEPGHSLLCW